MRFVRVRYFGAEGFEAGVGFRADDKRVGARGHEREQEGVATLRTAGHFEFQPYAQAGIVDLGAAVPEIGIKGALDLKIVEPQLDGGCSPREVAPRIRFADMEAGIGKSVAIGFHQHDHLPVVEVAE